MKATLNLFLSRVSMDSLQKGLTLSTSLGLITQAPENLRDVKNGLYTALLQAFYSASDSFYTATLEAEKCLINFQLEVEGSVCCPNSRQGLNSQHL